MRNRSLKYVCMWVCVCVLSLVHGTFCLQEEGGGREDNLAFFEALSSDPTTPFKLPFPENSPYPQSDVWILSPVITSVKISFTCAERKSGQGCAAVAVSFGRNDLLHSECSENLWFLTKCYLQNSQIDWWGFRARVREKKEKEKENCRHDTQAQRLHWRFPLINCQTQSRRLISDGNRLCSSIAIAAYVNYQCFILITSICCKCKTYHILWTKNCLAFQRMHIYNDKAALIIIKKKSWCPWFSSLYAEKSQMKTSTIITLFWSFHIHANNLPSANNEVMVRFFPMLPQQVRS